MIRASRHDLLIAGYAEMQWIYWIWKLVALSGSISGFAATAQINMCNVWSRVWLVVRADELFLLISFNLGGHARTGLRPAGGCQGLPEGGQDFSEERVLSSSQSRSGSCHHRHTGTDLPTMVLDLVRFLLPQNKLGQWLVSRRVNPSGRLGQIPASEFKSNWTTVRGTQSGKFLVQDRPNPDVLLKMAKLDRLINKRSGMPNWFPNDFHLQNNSCFVVIPC